MDGPSNGGAKAVRVITEEGAFGVPGHMVVIRRWVSPVMKAQGKQKSKEPPLTVASFVIVDGDEKTQLEAAEEMKKQAIVDPLFYSFTVLKFVSETRPLEEPKEKSKIVIPTTRDVSRFSRSKYEPE